MTADSDIAPEELARLLRAAYFSPSDDADADSWETQLTRFEEDALHMSLKLMCSVEEARQRTIADAVWREIFWLMPRDRTVTIVVRGGKVSVDIGPVCTEAGRVGGDAVTGCSVAFAPGLSPSPLVPFPDPGSSNRTCGFPASGFRTRSCLRARKGHGLPRETQEAVICAQPLFGVSHESPRPRLVLSTEPLA